MLIELPFSLSLQNRYLGDAVPPAVAIIVRAVRADGKMQGYQIAAYKDAAAARVQVIMAALAENENWKMCADGILLSKHKVMVRPDILNQTNSVKVLYFGLQSVLYKSLLS